MYLVVANVPALMCSIGISKESSYAGLLLNLHERYPELLWDKAPLHAVHWKLLLQRLPALACPLLWKAALDECLASSSSPGGGSRAYLRADSTPESPAQWCRGFFYRITVIMGQEAIMRLTDARGYVVGTSQVSICGFVKLRGWPYLHLSLLAPMPELWGK